MEDTTIPVLYFGEPGPQNTERLLEVALERAKALSIKHFVVASDTGNTARRVLELVGPNNQVVVVTNPAGLSLPVAKLHDYLPRFRAHKEALLAKGVKAVRASISNEVMEELTSKGAVVTRLDWKRIQTFARSGLGAIDKIGVGVRVAFTVAIWARLADAIPVDSQVISLAGTGFGGGGADTAIVVQPGSIWKDFRVVETIARPRISPPSEG